MSDEDITILNGLLYFRPQVAPGTEFHDNVQFRITLEYVNQLDNVFMVD